MLVATFIVLITKFLMIFSILELVTCFKTGGPRLGLTMSQGATRRKSLGTTAVTLTDQNGGLNGLLVILRLRQSGEGYGREAVRVGVFSP